MKFVDDDDDDDDDELQELWALFDWVHEGQLLGTAKTFSMEYETPIMTVSMTQCLTVMLCLVPKLTSNCSVQILYIDYRQCHFDRGDKLVKMMPL